MERVRSRKKRGVGAVILTALKGTLIGVIATVVAILVFGLIVKETNPADGVIVTVNQIIKIVCILLSAFLAVRGACEKLWLIGGTAGLLYTVIGYLVFSAVDGAMGSVLQLASDALLSVLLGAVTGVVYGFIKRK